MPEFTIPEWLRLLSLVRRERARIVRHAERYPHERDRDIHKAEVLREIGEKLTAILVGLGVSYVQK